MSSIRCPKCGNILDTYIGALHPMEAVAAEMLEKGIIFHCPGCHSRNYHSSDLTCPQCNTQKLGSSISEEKIPDQIMKKVEGSIYCLNCEFKFTVL